MKKTRRTTEQIIRILRDADTGLSAEAVCRKHGISTQTFYRWREKYAGMDLKEAQRLRDLEKENGELKKLLADHMLQVQALKIALEKKHLSPERRRETAQRVQSALSCSGRSISRWLGFSRSSLRYRPKPLPPKKRLLEAQIIKISREHPTLGYKKITALLRREGYCVNKKQVQRIRREEGLQVPPPPARLRRQGLSTGLPQQAAHCNHVWCWDFMSDYTQRG